jgi:hypothetical protein
MIKQFEFYKEHGRWYIDLPEWEGSKEDLEMVLGADMLLDNIARGNDWCKITLSDEPFEGSHILSHRLPPLEATPGWYDNDAWHGPSTIWLCEVTRFVFGNYPDKIYYL